MRRLLRGVFGRAWRATHRLRRPVVHMAYNHLAFVQREVGMKEMLPPILDRIDGMNWALHVKVDALNSEMSLVLDSVVRELARLQMQVEALEEALREARSGRGGFAVVDADPAGDDADAEGRMLAG
jgi:hypothetical protein